APRATLLPYTTLFRSRADPEVAEDARARGEKRRARRRAGAGARDREEVEAAPVAAEIEDDATALGRDPLHRAVQEVAGVALAIRSEEHTSELQSRVDL